jgi:RND family efflux transporter MFP subunit
MTPVRPSARLAFALFTALAAPLALTACSEGTASVPPTAPRAVVVETVAFAPVVAERSFVGTVRPRIESDLGFRVAGKIAERLVQQGERVSAGQRLARLDDTDFALQLEQARAELAAAETGLATAERQDRRTEDLKRAGWTTQAALDQQMARSADARSRLERARRATELAENQMRYATLVAEAEGIVTATLAEPGQVVAAGTPIVRIARGSEREAVVAIPEFLVERVRTADASVSLWSHAGTAHPARLRELAAAADPATRTYQARFAMPEADETVKIGMTATVTLREPDSAKVARLPISALFAEGKGPHLFVVTPDTGALTLKPVVVAGYDEGEVQIAAGISEGEKVVAFGVQKLDPGQTVRIVETRPARR